MFDICDNCKVERPWSCPAKNVLFDSDPLLTPGVRAVYEWRAKRCCPSCFEEITTKTVGSAAVARGVTLLRPEGDLQDHVCAICPNLARCMTLDVQYA